MSDVQYIDSVEIKDKKVLLRVDFNVALTPNSTIADDARIQQALPTVKQLLQNNNKLIITAHLGRPKGRDPQFSLKPVAERLQALLHEQGLNDISVQLVDDFLTYDTSAIDQANNHTIFMLENMRYYPEEKKNDPEFAKKLASLANVYVNDAFGVAHRSDASVVGVTQYLPSYGGLLLKKEIEMISKVINNPQKPIVAILGGAKVSTKINLINRLMEIVDYLIVGGGMANTFLFAQGHNIGKSFHEYEQDENAKRILATAAEKHTEIILPDDAVVSETEDATTGGTVVKVEEVTDNVKILDIGPETQAKIGALIAKAHTIIWNGPVGLFENPSFRRGTDFIYYAITQNTEAFSVVGGGDTLAAISKKEYLDKISHISTGGGAMLEFIEKGTLPGIEALKKTGQSI